MCKRLKKTDVYASRIAASMLYANVYPRLESQEKRENVQRKFKKLVQDDTPMVRWGAA